MVLRLLRALLWLALGVFVGIRLSNMVHRTRERARPAALAEGAGRGVGTLQARLRGAVAEGRAAAGEREQLLRQRFGVRTMAELAAEVADGAGPTRPGDPAPTEGGPAGDPSTAVDPVTGDGDAPTPPTRKGT